MRIEKQQAINLRHHGWSYSDISRQLNVPKSTLSGWLHNIPYIPNATVQNRISTGRGLYGIRRQYAKQEETEHLRKEGRREVGVMSKRDLWMVGLGLWLGEGSKTLEQIRLVNSSPGIIRLFLRWLREVCELDDNNITVAMHLYPDSDIEKSQEYWATITGLSLDRFRKTQIDRRPNKNMNKSGLSPFGTLHVTVVSNGDSERGVRLFRRLKGWVSGVTDQA